MIQEDNRYHKKEYLSKAYYRHGDWGKLLLQNGRSTKADHC
jgi:hypothetical protein